MELAALNLTALTPLSALDRDLVTRWRVGSGDSRAVHIIRVGRLQRALNADGADLIVDGMAGGRTLRALRARAWSGEDRALLRKVLGMCHDCGAPGETGHFEGCPEPARGAA